MLPPLYARWLGPERVRALPQERRAPCSGCVMLAETPQPAHERPLVPFDPRTKCCTYQPVLPNFSLGLALLDPERMGVQAREALAQSVWRGVALTPLGLGRAPAFVRRYDEPGANERFGREPSMRCPFYVESAAGTCGIWGYRPAVCATWFCRHERRARGRRLWAALQGLLSEIEVSVAIACAKALGLGHTVCRHLLPDPQTGRVPEPLAWRADGTLEPRERKRLWGRWAKAPLCWFLAVADHVRSLERTEIERMGGRSLRLAYERFDRALAAYARPFDPEARYRVCRPRESAPIEGTPALRRLVTYSRHDPLWLPADLCEALGWLDPAKPARVWLERVRVRLGAARAVALETALESLLDAGVLVPLEDQGREADTSISTGSP